MKPTLYRWTYEEAISQKLNILEAAYERAQNKVDLLEREVSALHARNLQLIEEAAELQAQIHVMRKEKRSQP